ncbi:MAG: hypothetical protein ABIO44_04080, partial [Saprospiraceae bacterium]
MQYQKQFYNAAIVYKDYLKELKKSNPTRIQIEQEIVRCLNGLKINKKENVAIVEPLGTTLNTVNDEFAPIPSINFQGKYYFSAVKSKVLDAKKNLFSPLQSDLFTIEDNNGNWSAIHSLGAPFDSPKNEMILDLIDKGNGIVFLRSSNESDAEIMFKSFSSNGVEEDVQLDLPLNVNKGDRDLCFFQDSIIIFSSNRPGGYGGYDLYLSIKRGGTWMPPKNLGADVNGPFNEVSPFIAKDGQTLFFSSNDLESIGGYDVFKVKFKPESNNWSIKENLGIPINSAGNELQFRLDRSGRSGVFSSDRWDKTIGGKDIFIAYFKDELEEQFYEESGTVLPIFYSEHSIPTKAMEGTSPKRDTFQKVKEYTIDFISSGDDDFLSDTKKQNVITEVLKLLKLYPNSQLQIIAHSNSSSNVMINLFTSIKKSNEVANSFISKNINSNRIKSIGCGSEYLVCKSNGQTNAFANNLNNRIEFHFLFGNKEKANINYSLLKLNENLRLNPLYQFHQSRLGISYSILLGESTQMLSQDITI